jgi:hypothetical protein
MHPPAASLLVAADVSPELVFPLVIAIAVALAAFWLLLLIDALSWPRPTWSAAGHSRGRWVMRIFLLGTIGAALYLRGPRRDLRAAYKTLRAS